MLNCTLLNIVNSCYNELRNHITPENFSVITENMVKIKVASALLSSAIGLNHSVDWKHVSYFISTTCLWDDTEIFLRLAPHLILVILFNLHTYFQVFPFLHRNQSVIEVSVEEYICFVFLNWKNTPEISNKLISSIQKRKVPKYGYYKNRNKK